MRGTARRPECSADAAIGESLHAWIGVVFTRAGRRVSCVIPGDAADYGGRMVATPLSFVWTWLFFAYEYVSRSLVRHAVQPKNRFGPMFSHKAVFIGFGASAWLLSFIPFLAPVLVVAATRLYLSLAIYDRVPSLYTPEEKNQLKVT